MSLKIGKLLCSLKSMNRVPSTSSIISVSIGDILLLRDDLPTETQFITIARLMDVIEYFKSPNTYDFKYRNTICKTVYGSSHDSNASNINFKALITSFEKHGFLKDYPLVLDESGKLYDGNHRCGISAYFGIQTLYVKRCLSNTYKTSNNIDFFIEKGLSTSFITSVCNKFFEFQEWLIKTKNTFAISVSGYSSLQERNDFVHRLEFLCRVLGAIEINDHKIIIQFGLNDPKFFFTESQLKSRRSIEIERILRTNYPEWSIHVSKSCLEGRTLCKENEIIV